MKFTASLIWPLFCIAAGIFFLEFAQGVAAWIVSL